MGTARQLWSQVRGEHRSGNGEGHPLLRHEDPSLLFGHDAFETQICTIEAHPGNLLRFIFTDDSTTDYVWKDRSRSESWTDEMKAAAGRKTKERDANHGK